jgi:hypothetical protein
MSKMQEGVIPQTGHGLIDFSINFLEHTVECDILFSYQTTAWRLSWKCSQENKDKHPCLKRESNSRYQCLNGLRQYVSDSLSPVRAETFLRS